VAAQGRTGMVSLVVGSALLLLRRYPRGAPVPILAVAALAAVIFGNGLVRLFLRGEDQELLYSLSGRTSMWDVGWSAFLANPFHGFGFGEGSRTVMFMFGNEVHQASSLHNGPLEVLLGVGIIGFAIWAYAVLWGCYLVAGAYLKGRDYPVIFGMFEVIAATFLSIGLGGWLDIHIQYFLAASALLWVQKQRVRREQRSEIAAGDEARPLWTARPVPR
jgi:O-antigen ligase